MDETLCHQQAFRVVAAGRPEALSDRHRPKQRRAGGQTSVRRSRSNLEPAHHELGQPIH